ncbi:MAG: ATP-binding protein [Parvibaculaceae bacterium]
MADRVLPMDPGRDQILKSLDGLTDGIGIFDGRRVLTHANRSFLNTFDIDARSVAGQLAYEELIRRIAHSGELVLPLPPQEWVERRLAEFGLEKQFGQAMADGRTLQMVQTPAPKGGMTLTFHDVTGVKLTELALRRAKDEADASSEAKSRFLRAANHDLRQPLSTLRILIFNCCTEADEEHRKDLLHAMDISVSIMEDLLGALLQIGQLDAGQIVPRISTFQLSQIFERIDLQFQHQAQEKGLRLKLVPTRGAVVSDKALLERILTNLVANAIRYTDVGGILVGCRHSAQAVRIEVWDTGRGIAPENLEKIFQEFYQVPEERRVKRRGLGLGLNIVQRLAALLGHKVEVRSLEGRGSIFSVEVPVGDIWQSDAVAPEISETVGGEFAGISVLLIEDDEVLRQAMKELLERWGLKVCAVHSEDDARRHLANGHVPRLIIADYSLRGQIGTTVVRNIRQAAETEIPAVIVTADIDPKVVAEIAESGLPVLIKPVSPPRLRVMMHNLLFEPTNFTG